MCFKKLEQQKVLIYEKNETINNLTSILSEKDAQLDRIRHNHSMEIENLRKQLKGKNLYQRN